MFTFKTRVSFFEKTETRSDERSNVTNVYGIFFDLNIKTKIILGFSGILLYTINLCLYINLKYELIIVDILKVLSPLFNYEFYQYSYKVKYIGPFYLYFKTLLGYESLHLEHDQYFVIELKDEHTKKNVRQKKTLK